jgi:hypothetical protein
MELMLPPSVLLLLLQLLRQRERSEARRRSA